MRLEQSQEISQLASRKLIQQDWCKDEHWLPMMLVTAARHQARPTRLIPAEKASPKCKYHMMCSFDSCVLCMHMFVLHISSMEGAPFSNRNYHAKPHLYDMFLFIYIYIYIIFIHAFILYHVLLTCFAKTKTHHANLRRTSQHFFWHPSFMLPLAEVWLVSW